MNLGEEFNSILQNTGQLISDVAERTQMLIPGQTDGGSSLLGGFGGAFSGFITQFQNRDFGIFKWVLIGALILLPIIVLFLILSGKLVLFNTMFGDGYGLKLITGTFGAGKTKNVFQSAFLRKKENPNGIIISNLNYSFVDLRFDSPDDFDDLLGHIVQYIRDTNNEEELKKNYNFPPIKIIVDEAHIYLFSRDFKKFTKDTLLVLTQCRKRSISVDFITQELGQVDVFIRRLAPYIHYFETLPLGLRKQSILYSLNADSVSMREENAFDTIETSFLLPDSWALFFKPKLKAFYDQRYLTKYVIGGLEHFKISYNDFKNLLRDKVLEYRKPKPLKDPKFPVSFKTFKIGSGDEQQKKIDARDRIIEYLLTKVSEDDLQNIKKGVDDNEKSQTSGEKDNQL